MLFIPSIRTFWTQQIWLIQKTERKQFKSHYALNVRLDNWKASICNLRTISDEDFQILMDESLNCVICNKSQWRGSHRNFDRKGMWRDKTSQLKVDWYHYYSPCAAGTSELPARVLLSCIDRAKKAVSEETTTSHHSLTHKAAQCFRREFSLTLENRT